LEKQTLRINPLITTLVTQDLS